MDDAASMPASGRDACRLVLAGEVGYSVIEAHNGITTLTDLLSSPRPLVVLLDAYLAGRDAAMQLLRLAASGGPAARHRYVVCITQRFEHLPQELASQITTIGALALPMPFDLDELLDYVARAAATLPVTETT